jgi:hypothetical protein
MSTVFTRDNRFTEQADIVVAPQGFVRQVLGLNICRDTAYPLLSFWTLYKYPKTQ